MNTVFVIYLLLIFKKMDIESTIKYIINQTRYGLAKSLIRSSLTLKTFNGPLLSYKERICSRKYVIGNNNTAEKNTDTIFILKSNKIRFQQFDIVCRINPFRFIDHQFTYFCRQLFGTKTGDNPVRR